MGYSWAMSACTARLAGRRTSTAGKAAYEYVPTVRGSGLNLLLEEIFIACSGAYLHLLRPSPTRHASALAGSMRGDGSYLRFVGRTPEERKEQRKAARLSLDTSAHAGSEYRRFVRECSAVRCAVSLCLATEISRDDLRSSGDGILYGKNNAGSTGSFRLWFWLLWVP